MEFNFKINRSERAKQADLLVPALNDINTRWELIKTIRPETGNPITKYESDSSEVMHFVWVLRDTFYFERDNACKTKAWDQLRIRWCDILGLPNWAQDSAWWRHPEGSFKGDAEFVVHPCSRDVGWTENSIKRRVDKFLINDKPDKYMDILVNARKIMNTECDCFIQTPCRLIIIECKDKTEFINEQKVRQKKLFRCLQRLLKPREQPIYVEISNKLPETPLNQWSWDMLPKSE